MVNKNDKSKPQDDIEITGEESFDEEPELEDIEESEKDKISLLRKKLNDCEESKRKNLEELQLVKAEFLNSRKRLEEDKERQVRRASLEVVGQLLPLCDSFGMAFSSPDWEKADESWRKGIEGINSQLQAILKAHGVEKIDPTGQEFDPSQHEALSTAPVKDEKMHDKVVEMIQPGYKVSEGDTFTVIRPARVIIGNFETN